MAKTGPDRADPSSLLEQKRRPGWDRTAHDAPRCPPARVIGNGRFVPGPDVRAPRTGSPAPPPRRHCTVRPETVFLDPIALPGPVARIAVRRQRLEEQRAHRPLQANAQTGSSATVTMSCLRSRTRSAGACTPSPRPPVPDAAGERHAGLAYRRNPSAARPPGAPVPPARATRRPRNRRRREG